MTCNKRSEKHLHLGRNNLRHQYMLEAIQVKKKTALQKKNLGDLVDTNLNISHQCAHAARKAVSINCTRQSVTSRSRDPSSPVRADDAIPGVRCPVLVLCPQSREI